MRKLNRQIRKLVEERNEHLVLERNEVQGDYHYAKYSWNSYDIHQLSIFKKLRLTISLNDQPNKMNFTNSLPISMVDGPITSPRVLSAIYPSMLHYKEELQVFDFPFHDLPSRLLRNFQLYSPFFIMTLNKPIVFTDAYRAFLANFYPAISEQFMAETLLHYYPSGLPHGFGSWSEVLSYAIFS